MLNQEIMDKAYKYLTTAILNEANNEMAKARMALAMACKYELEALGFKTLAVAADILKSILPWEQPAYLQVQVAKAA